LRTWALSALPHGWQAAQSYTAAVFPSCAPASMENIVVAEPLGDHRRDYLEYEGPVSGQRGQVSRIDAGSYETLSESRESWTVELSGVRLRGAAMLTAGIKNTDKWTLSLQTSN
jgi:hypothetical protein